MTYTEPNPVRQEIPPDEKTQLLLLFTQNSEYIHPRSAQALAAAEERAALYGTAQAIQKRQQ